MSGQPNSDCIDDGAPVIAGVGFSSRAAAGDIVQAVRAALQQHNCAAQRLITLASIAAKQDSNALSRAARELDVGLVLIEADAALSASKRGSTNSQLSIESTGLPSVCEAAALAAAGSQSRLLAARIKHGRVTCALAVNGARLTPEHKLPGSKERIQS